MRKPKLIRTLAVALVAITAVTLSVSAGAATLYEKVITVYTGVNIMVDGVELMPTDANGNPVDPFLYNGTTYIPLRAVGEALGKPVNWDGTTRTVYVGKIPGQDMYLKDVCPPYQTSGFATYDYVTLAGNRYLDNMCFPESFYNESWALYNLNGQFTTLEFDVGHRDECVVDRGNLNIYLDGALAYTMELNYEMLPTHVIVPLNGALQMKIAGSGCGFNYAIVNATIE